MKPLLKIAFIVGALVSFGTHAAVAGDPMAAWLKDTAFKKLYSQALGKSPASHKGSWAYKDIGIAPSKAIAGQNANTWVLLTTCASKTPASCRASYIDVFYDAENKELFAYVTLGNRVGWIGNDRPPTSLEQNFFTSHLTAKKLTAP